MPEKRDVRLSNRSGHLREAGILRALTLKVNALDDGINLGQGVCDLEMPEILRLAAIASINKDRATYTNYAGILPIREQIVRRYLDRHGLEYSVDEVVTTTGASGAFMATLMTLSDADGEIVLFEPFYPYHYTAALLAGMKVKTVPEPAESGDIDFKRLEEAIGPETRVVVLNTPSNPTGRVWTASELDRLAHLLKGTNTIVVTDEIYEDLVYDGNVHVPPATHPLLYDRTVTISGLSKAYSITGWRIGWLCAPLAMSSAIGPVFDTMSVCAPRPLQVAAATALRDLPESYYTDMRDGYQARRDRLHAALRGGGFKVSVPAGAYYMLADYSDRFGNKLNPMDACFRLLDEAGIAAIPGTIFYSGSPAPVLRFQFAVEDAVIDEVARRLR